jgi:GDP-4-dehydro-6-deoxy-D-mannose reductase
VDDVVRAFEAVALRGRAGEAYNVCQGRGYTMQEALDALLARARVSIAVESDPARMRPADVPALVGANDKLREECGWAPKKTFEELLDDLLAYWRGRVVQERA